MSLIRVTSDNLPVGCTHRAGGRTFRARRFKRVSRIHRPAGGGGGGVNFCTIRAAEGSVAA